MHCALDRCLAGVGFQRLTYLFLYSLSSFLHLFFYLFPYSDCLPFCTVGGWLKVIMQVGWKILTFLFSCLALCTLTHAGVLMCFLFLTLFSFFPMLLLLSFLIQPCLCLIFFTCTTLLAISPYYTLCTTLHPHKLFVFLVLSQILVQW